MTKIPTECCKGCKPFRCLSEFSPDGDENCNSMKLQQYHQRQSMGRRKRILVSALLTLKNHGYTHIEGELIDEIVKEQV